MPNWTLRENVRAHPRVIVKRLHCKYGYPPDKQETATQTVLEAGWAPLGPVSPMATA
jgi:hypothetical protein